MQLLVFLLLSARMAMAAVVTVDFDMGVTFGDLVVDTSTYIAHVDVTINLPFENARLIPYLQVGPAYNLPTATYTQSNPGNTPLDTIPCLASRSPMTKPADFSCATLSREQLLPFNCSAVNMTPPGSFTLDDVRAHLRVASRSFPHPSTTGSLELAMLPNEASPHHHYAITSHVKGVLHPLYCGEALLTSDAATAAATCAQYDQTSTPNDNRIHAAQIVPFVSFPSPTKMTYHFQYSIPQLQLDCAHNGVTTTMLYDENGSRVIGSQTTFTLAFGYVYPSFTVHTDQRQYQVNLYTGSSSQSNDAVFSVAFEMPSQYQVSLTLCDNPMPIYVNRTWAQLPYCYAVTYLNVGDFGSSVGPRILMGLDGNEYGDIDTVVLPNNVFQAHLVSITPGYDARTGENRVFCPPNSMRCVFVFRFVTAPQKLSADGRAFIATRNTDNRGPFDMAFPAYKCDRDVTSGQSSQCALVVPQAAGGNTTFYDTFLVTLTKNVYPDMNATYVFASRLDLFTQSDIAHAHLLDVACRATTDSMDVGVDAICRDVPREAVRTARGNTVAIYMSLVNPVYWNNSLGVEEIDPSTIVFTIRGRRPQSYGIDPFTIRIDSSDPVKWQAFQQAWTYVPRRTSDVASGKHVAPLVAETRGIDALHVDYSKLFFLLVDHYGVQYTDILDTLAVSAFVEYRYAGRVPQRRLLSTDDVPIGGDVPVGLSVSSTQGQTIPMTRFEMTCVSSDHTVTLELGDCSRSGVSWVELAVILVAYAVVLTCVCIVVYRHSVPSFVHVRHVRRSSDELDDDVVGPLISTDTSVDVGLATFTENPFSNIGRTQVRSRNHTPIAPKRSLK